MGELMDNTLCTEANYNGGSGVGFKWLYGDSYGADGEGGGRGSGEFYNLSHDVSEYKKSNWC